MAYIEASAFIYQDGKVSILFESAKQAFGDEYGPNKSPSLNCFWLLKILIEVDHLQDVPSPYIQIKGVNKKAVTAAGSALKLDGSYTTKVPFLSSFTCMLRIISLLFPLVFLNEELPSNSFGKTTTSSEKFKWNPYTTSSAVARTCGIHTVSGNQIVSALSPLLSSHYSGFSVSEMGFFSLPFLKGSSNSASEASPRRDGSSIDNVLDDMQSRIKRLERWHTINTVWHQKLIVFKRLNTIFLVY